MPKKRGLVALLLTLNCAPGAQPIADPCERPCVVNVATNSYDLHYYFDPVVGICLVQASSGVAVVDCARVLLHPGFAAVRRCAR